MARSAAAPFGCSGPRGRGRLHWLRHERCWLLPAAGGSLLALVPAGERWTVLRPDPDAPQPLAGEVDLGYAQGIAEDYLRAPMSPAQAGSLKRLGVPVP